MASTNLNRTPSSASNRRTWTWSAWVKRSNISTGNQVLFQGMTGGFPEKLQFTSGDYLEYDHDIAGTDYTVYTSRLFRDVNAWYHIMWVKDTTQATETDRIKLYVNGEQQTLTEHQLGYPPQNYEGQINNNVEHCIGSNTNDGEFFSGLMSHVHLVDGSALAPTVFGSTDSTTGEWKINTSPSVTYGTNGFFMFKDDNSLNDDSGNGNNFALEAGTLTKTEDNPSNVFATLNPLSTPSTLSNGNLQAVYAGSGSYATASSTLGMTSGKWYCEVKLTLTNNYPSTGICATNSSHATKLSQSDWLGSDADTYGMYTNSGQVYNTGNIVNTFGAISTGDILGMALDLDSAQNTLKYYKNGSLIGTQNITTNSNGWMFGCTNQNTGTTNAQFNFGNGFFGTTAVSSAGTNASNNGIFEYDVPSGYTALSTKGLNT